MVVKKVNKIKSYLVIFLCMISLNIIAQTKVPRLTKYEIGNTGVKMYFPTKPINASVSLSEDSSKITTVEVADSSQGTVFYFGAIVVELKDGTFTGNEDDMMKAYLDYLKTAFEVTNATGYGLGHTLNTHPTAKGIIDYWKTKSQQEIKVKAWTAEKNMIVAYVLGKTEYPIFNIQEMYLNGVRFAGDK